MGVLKANVAGTWVAVSQGGLLIPGGTAGQVLVKNSATDGDASWKPQSRRVLYVGCPAADQPGFNATISDISGSSATWTVEAGRQYLMSFQYTVFSTVAALVNVYVVGNAGTPQYCRVIGNVPFAGAYNIINGQLFFSGLTPGAFSIKMQMNVTSGAGTIVGYATTGIGGSGILVEDVGV